MNRVDIPRLKHDIKTVSEELKAIKVELRTPHQPNVTWRTYYTLKDKKQWATVLCCIRALARNAPKCHLPKLTLEQNREHCSGTFESYLLPEPIAAVG